MTHFCHISVVLVATLFLVSMHVPAATAAASPKSKGCSVWNDVIPTDIMCDALRELRDNITEMADDVRTIKHMVTESPKLHPSCQAILQAGDSLGNGWYWIQPECSAVPLNVYCDLESGSGGCRGWMRLHYKEGANTCFDNRQVTWTPHLVDCLGISSNGVDFAISEDTQRVASSTGLSWVLRDVTWSGGHTSSRLSNLLSCLTPTGSQWSQDYEGGYVSTTGRFETFGSFTTMYVGCDWSSIATIGQSRSMRMGGGPGHTGEFIHTACNGYGINRDNSVTSRWNSPNTRVFWVKPSDTVAAD